MLQSYSTNGKQLVFDTPHVMAIVNLTPDSFYDGGQWSSIPSVLKHVEACIRAGASIIDVGGMSTKPNAIATTEEEEKKRLHDALKEIRTSFPNVFISVDTYRSQIAEMSIDLGADLINDISGGNMDPRIMDIVVKHQIPYVITHLQGNPQTMQQHPHYLNVVEEVNQFFKMKIEAFRHRGFQKLILDPGFGFGKKVNHNYQLLKNLHVFTSHGYPVLAGLSRKSMINNIIHTSPQTALNGTTVLNTIALQNRANILRVHDVKEAKEAIDLLAFYQQA